MSPLKPKFYFSPHIPPYKLLVLDWDLQNTVATVLQVYTYFYSSHRLRVTILIDEQAYRKFKKSNKNKMYSQYYKHSIDWGSLLAPYPYAPRMTLVSVEKISVNIWPLLCKFNRTSPVQNHQFRVVEQLQYPIMKKITHFELHIFRVWTVKYKIRNKQWLVRYLWITKEFCLKCRIRVLSNH